MLQRVQFDRSFSPLRARSHGAAEWVEESCGSVDVARFEVAVEEWQRLRNRQLISIAVVTRVAVRRKDVAASQDLAVTAGPRHLQRTMIGQSLLCINPAEQEIAA